MRAPRTGVSAASMVLAVAGLAACGDGGADMINPTALIPSCAAWETTIVDRDTLDGHCTMPDDPTYIALVGIFDCNDGRALWWNDWGWGWIGKTAQPHAPDADEQVAPQAERDACKPPSG